MPSTINLRVCVISLTYQQYIGVDSQALLLLSGKSNPYKVVEQGRIYGDSPDEWHPFEDTKSILEYLRDAGFEDVSLSKLIASFDNMNDLNTLLTNVDLYVFDPLFLTLSGNPLQLVDRLQSAILSAKKPFCILMPDRI